MHRDKERGPERTETRAQGGIGDQSVRGTQQKVEEARAGKMRARAAVTALPSPEVDRVLITATALTVVLTVALTVVLTVVPTVEAVRLRPEGTRREIAGGRGGVAETAETTETSQNVVGKMATEGARASANARSKTRGSRSKHTMQLTTCNTQEALVACELHASARRTISKQHTTHGQPWTSN
jgi:hypothetical protein